MIIIQVDGVFLLVYDDAINEYQLLVHHTLSKIE